MEKKLLPLDVFIKLKNSKKYKDKMRAKMKDQVEKMKGKKEDFIEILK
jgi:hypothetical protein